MVSADENQRLTRYYIDVRPLVPSDPKIKPNLPLLSSLSAEDQEKINRYMRSPDRLMSLASALLKRLFIHRTVRIPWSEVHVSRTPKPHLRPYWEPPSTWTKQGGLEFNVSHQAGMVALLGCRTPDSSPPQHVSPDGVLDPSSTTLSDSCSQIRLGIDIACVNEDRRTPSDITSQAKFDDWVDIFSEMFSDRERSDMKTRPPVLRSQMRPQEISETVAQKLRRFYAYWALKEAYIKMVGEGLMADWLKELEFFNVNAPAAVGIEQWTPSAKVERYMATLFQGSMLEDVEMALVSYEEDFLIATSTRGIGQEANDAVAHWTKLDIERDVGPCAAGRCSCLE